MTYRFHCQVTYDKGPQFGSEFEVFLRDINIEPTPLSANILQSNGLAESLVKSAKILLRKSIEKKINYPEMMCHFKQAPREEGY